MANLDYIPVIVPWREVPSLNREEYKHDVDTAIDFYESRILEVPSRHIDFIENGFALFCGHHPNSSGSDVKFKGIGFRLGPYVESPVGNLSLNQFQDLSKYLSCLEDDLEHEGLQLLEIYRNGSVSCGEITRKPTEQLRLCSNGNISDLVVVRNTIYNTPKVKDEQKLLACYKKLTNDLDKILKGK